MSDSLLAVDDLTRQLRYRRRARAGARSCDVRHEAWRDRRTRRRVRAAARPPSRAPSSASCRPTLATSKAVRIRFEGEDLLQSDPADIATPRARPHRDVRAAGPVHLVQSRLHHRRPDHGADEMEVAAARLRRSAYPARYPRARRKADREAVIELLAAVQLPDPESMLAKYPHEFSGGQRQRLMIAMALLPRPQAHHRRRADDRARRHDPGADPEAAASARAGARRVGALHHARPRRRPRDLRPHHRDVCRPGGGDRAGRRVLRRARAIPTRARCSTACRAASAASAASAARYRALSSPPPAAASTRAASARRRNAPRCGRPSPALATEHTRALLSSRAPSPWCECGLMSIAGEIAPSAAPSREGEHCSTSRTSKYFPVRNVWQRQVGWLKALDDVSLDVRPGRDPRHRRRVGLRQVHARQDHHGHPPADGWPDRLRRQRHHRPAPRQEPRAAPRACSTPTRIPALRSIRAGRSAARWHEPLVIHTELSAPSA